MGRYDGEYASDKKNTLYEVAVDFLNEIGTLKNDVIDDISEEGRD